MRDAATLPLTLGGLGLRKATRVSGPAHWASWADCLAMVHARHPDVAMLLVHHLEGGATTPCLREVRQVAHDLFEAGFEPHSWRALLAGARPERNEVDEFEWGCGSGWQHEAASRVERHHRDDHIFSHLTDPARALLLSQGGPGSGLALSTCPRCRITRMGPQHFRILLLRRLQLPLPLTVRSCRCGRPLDIYGHHRAACARAGVLGRRGFALESVVARICREAGGRASTNVFVRDLDLHLPNAADGRRLEVAVDGLPLFGGAQLTLDTTLVSALVCQERSVSQ